MNRVDDVLKRHKALTDERRRSVDALAKEVSEYICPARGIHDGDDKRPDSRHAKRGDKIIDSTPQDAHWIATNGMYSGLTPPSRPWFRLRLMDDDLQDYGPAAWYMDELTARVYSILRTSNFYSAIHNNFAEIIAFSNAMIGMHRDPLGRFRFRPYTWGEYCWAADEQGRVDTVYRTDQMSARQMLQAFGEQALGSHVMDALKGNPYTAFEVLHIVQPRKERDSSRVDARAMAYESLYLDLRDARQSHEGSFLRESGFERLPYTCSRWSVVGSDVYGSDGPGYRKLPDCKMLQDMEESSLMAAHREIDPPVLAPQSMQGNPIRKNSGGVTYYDTTRGPEAIRRLYDFRFDLQAGELKSEAVRQRIMRGFFSDLFLMINSWAGQKSNVTATQIMEMQSEKLLQLGAIIDRQTDEVLDPVVGFVVDSILEDPGRHYLPLPPPELTGEEYKIEYVSLLAQAQRAIGTKTIDDMVNFAGAAAQLQPEVLDVIDFDEAMRERADMVGAPAKIVRAADAVNELRTQRQEQQQAQQMAAEAQAAAQGMRDLGQVKLNADDSTVASELLKGMGVGV